MMLNWERLAPPGYPVKREQKVFFWVLALAAVFSLGFFFRYDDARDLLFRYRGNGMVILIQGAKIEPFGEILGRALWGFGGAALLALASAGEHYRFLRRDSRSDYLLRRLPDGGLLHRRCLTLPLMYLAMTAAAALVMLGLFYLTYTLRTPVGCLP